MERYKLDDLSDNSDLDMDKVAEMVGNLDDLDNDLFGDALLKENSYTTQRTQKNVRDAQKKVAFQDFDDDDNLLNDILSDNDDSNQISKPPSNVKDNKIADLFGAKSTVVKDINNPTKLSELKRNDIIKSSIEDDWTITNKSGNITSRPTIGKSSEKVENILNHIPTKHGVVTGLKSDTAKKSSLMEDLFGTRSRAASLKDIYNGPLDKNLIGTEESVSASMPNLIKNDQPSNPSNSSSGFSLSSSTSKEPRRGRPKSGIIDDPLGLLSASARIPEETPLTIKDNSVHVEKKSVNTASPSDDLPEWLGGKKKTTHEVDKRESISIPKMDENKCNNGVATNDEQKNTLLYPPASLLTGTQYEQQSAIVAMQQQEHELRTATILSHQTDQLNTIVECQKSKMDGQEKLFDNLIKRQIDRQAILETQIKLQQARIDNYIEALVKQPQIQLPTALGFTDKSTSDNKDNENSRILEQESLLHTLEVEKNSLEHMVDILKEKHEKEIKILEDSHETQMRYMQEAMDKLESKLRREIEELEKDYEKKIEKLSIEKNQQESYFKEQMDNFKTNEERRIEEIHNRHSEQITWLQKEHSEALENLVHAKELERNTVDFIKLHKTDLDSIIERSQHIYNGLEAMTDQIKTKDSEIINKREYYLKNQEDTLRVLIDQLKMQQEILDTERKQLTGVTQELKSESSQLSLYFQKNTEMYTEREIRHGMLERALIRERELFQEQSKWEREHLQSLKEAWITEQKQQMKLLARERESVAAEKAKLEVLSTFKSNSEDITKAELEAALKAAHNAAHEVNLERQKCQERSDSLDADRRRIEVKEKQLMQRAKELDELTKSAFTKRDEGIMALKEAQRIEKQHKHQLTQLQMQLEALAERENEIALEKISLARDRLALRVSQVEKPEKDVTNDSLRNHINESIYVPPTNMETHFKDVVDPRLVLLKLNLNNNLDTSNQLLTGIQTNGY